MQLLMEKRRKNYLNFYMHKQMEFQKKKSSLQEKIMFKMRFNMEKKKKSIKVKTRTRKSTNKPGYRFLVSLTGP